MKYNKGFTLAELLIVLGIIGIIMSTAIVTFKPFDKGIRYLHSNTYYVLNRAYYNVMNYYKQENLSLLDPFQVADVDSGTVDLDHTEMKDDGTKILCEGLKYYINTVEDNCTDRPVSRAAITTGDFSNEPAHLTAVNGIRFYISQRLGTTDENEFTHQRGFYFYLIFADLNGPKPPNSGVYMPADPNYKSSVTKDPDVFVFAAFNGSDDIGSLGISADAQLIPVGIVEFEPRYMQSRIIYTDSNAATVYGDSQYIKYSSGSQPYYISKCEAWGYYNDKNNGTTGTYSDRDPSKIQYLHEDPHSFSDYVRSQIDKTYTGNFITANITRWAEAYGKLHEIPDFSATGNSCTKEIRRNLHCGLGDEYADSCSVVIDKYVY